MKSWRTAARYGAPFGVGLAILGGGIALARTIDPSHDFTVLPYFWLLAAVICAFLVGFIAARATGSFMLGVDAGAVACAAPMGPIFLMTMFGSSYHYQQTYTIGQFLPGIVNAAIAIALLFFGGVACGAIFGGLVSIPGALLGRIQAGLDGAKTSPADYQEPPQDHSDDHLDAALLLANSSSADVTIDLSWTKSLLFLVLAFLFAAVAYSSIRIGQNTPLNWIAFCLFGLAVPLALANLVVNRPLLRFSGEGIAYRGGYFWLRGQVAWDDIAMIDLGPPSGYGSSMQELLLGRYELRIFFGDVGFRHIRFLNWQLPSTVKQSLRIAKVRYRKQIENNDIILHGIE